MRGALKDFQDNVARINEVMEWLTSPEVLTIKNMIHKVGVINGGCVVLLSGYFESFLKQCMHNFITAVNGLEKPFHVLPAEMRYTHFIKSGKALQKEIKRDKENDTTINAENMEARLASNQLVWEAFADTQANPGSNVIKKLIESVGIEKISEKLEAAEMGEKGRLKILLESFIAIRNECAHTGSTVSSLAASDLIGYGKNLMAIGEAIVALLEAHLERIKALED